MVTVQLQRSEANIVGARLLHEARTMADWLKENASLDDVLASCYRADLPALVAALVQLGYGSQVADMLEGVSA